MNNYHDFYIMIDWMSALLNHFVTKNPVFVINDSIFVMNVWMAVMNVGRIVMINELIVI